MIADVFRVVLFIAGATGIGLATAVAAPYAWSLLRRRGERRPLAAHVTWVSVSWVLLAGSAMVGTLTGLDEPLPWDFLLRGPGLLAGLVGVVKMMHHLVTSAAKRQQHVRALRGQVDAMRRQLP